MDNGHRLDLGLTEAKPAGDSCCGGGACGGAQSAPVDGATQQVLVTGMTCAHCVASVTEELSELPEVQGVTVDLRVGGESRVTIVTSAPVGDDRIRSAVEEAGYAVAGSTAE